MPKARQTCTECSMRRQKCDRQIPCGRCVRRGDGDKCTLIWPGNYDPKKHRIYPRPDTSPVAEEATLEHADSNLSEYDFKTTELLREPHLKYNGTTFEWDGSGFGGTGAAQMSFLQLLMPNRKQVFDMVEYHIQSILWYHGSFHGPTFRRELNEIYSSPSGFQVRTCDLRWLALLYAIMANSLTCASPQTAQSWDFSSDERPKADITMVQSISDLPQFVKLYAASSYLFSPNHYYLNDVCAYSRILGGTICASRRCLEDCSKSGIATIEHR